jgi:hypothetical protein
VNNFFFCTVTSQCRVMWELPFNVFWRCIFTYFYRFFTLTISYLSKYYM